MEECGDDGADRETKEGETPFTSREAVAGRAEDQRECFVEEVDDAVYEAVVNGGTEGNGLSEKKAEGPGKGDGEEGM